MEISSALFFAKFVYVCFDLDHSSGGFLCFVSKVFGFLNNWRVSMVWTHF